VSAVIKLRDVILDYPIYNASAMSLRTSVLSGAVGGRLYRKQNMPIVRALSGVSLEVKDGDRLALIGHNGSGKTTLLKVMAGIFEPSSGSADVHGRITSTIAVGSGLDHDSTGIQNVYKLSIIRGVSKKEIARKLDEIVAFSGLAQFARLPVRTYSAGMIARLIFATTTAFDPEILILDEWLGAGDADFMVQAEARMVEFVDKARLMVMASHNLNLVQHVCNKVCVLDGGTVKFFGSTADWIESGQSI
jgi:lipopolysaccharide transport system ATP-binding protein